MTTEINIFLIAVALVITLERVGFSLIKRKDRENGLHLNDSCYTLWGTARLLFMKPEDRLRKETEESFSDFLDNNEARKRRLFWVGTAYCAALAACVLIRIFSAHGLTNLALMNLSFIAIGISFLITKNVLLVILITAYGVVTALMGVSAGAFEQVLPMVTGIILVVVFGVTRHAYKKERTAAVR